MKKIKLFLAAMAAMVSLGINAQSWTGSDPAAGKFFLYNVGTGTFLCGGNSWGTHASVSKWGVDFILAGTDGVYTLDSQISNGGNSHFLAGEWTDGSATNWTFNKVSDSPITYTLNNGSGYLAANSSDTNVSVVADGTTNYAKWILVSRADIIAAMANATETNPVDATLLIPAADPGRNNQRNSSWTMTKSGGNQSIGGDDTNNAIESWNNTFEVSQTITDIPNGFYKVSVYGFGTNGTTYVFGNDVATAFVNTTGASNFSAASTAIRDGQYSGNITDMITVAANSLKLGVKRTSQVGADWAVFDKWELTYYGPLTDFSAYDNAIADLVGEASALQGTIPAAAYTALDNVVSANNNTYSSEDEYTTAIANINAALTTARAMVAPYAAYQAEVANATFAGVAAATISAQDEVVATATTATVISTAVSALKDAINALTFDITSFTIKNATAQSKTNWEGTDFGGQSNGVTEYWNVSPAGFYQTVNLPAGKYRMTVIALQRTGMTGTVYANENSTIIAQASSSEANSRSGAATWFNAGNGRNYVYFELTDATDVTVGLKVDETTGDHWTVWQGFTLDTFDESVAAGYLAPGFAELVATAQTTHDDAAYVNVTGNEKTALETAIAATPSTVAEYETAVAALNDAVSAFTAAKTNYDVFAAERTLADAISTDIVVAAPTTAAEALTQFRALKVAEYNYVADAYKFSATSKIGEFSTWTRTGTVNGNTKNQFEALTSQHWSGTARTYYEQPADGWNQNAWTANYTKTTTLPAGSYIVKVAARAASGSGTVAKITCSAATLDGPIFNFGDTGKGITTAGVASFDDGEFCNEGNGRGWVWNYLPFTLTEETEVTMTVVAEATGVHQWFSVCDGELLSKTNIATAVAYNETSNNTIENVDVANVNVSRAIKVGFNTVCLPFDLTANQVAAAFGAGTEVYEFSENSANPDDVTINFNKNVAGTISANVPVLVKATAASSAQTFEGVQVVAPTTDIKAIGTFTNFIGVYAPVTVAENDYFVGRNNEGNAYIYKSAGTTNINAFRAYIDAQNAQSARISLFIDGEGMTTGIEGLMKEESQKAGAVYDLQGRKVANPSRGLYIINGKKVIVK